MDGDIDIIVEQDNTVLLIQLKRTYLLLTPKDVYYESIMIDRKAAQQLNDAEVWLNKPNDIYSMEGKKVFKWIVTTSYEGVLSDVNGCCKVNYFDLLATIRHRKPSSLLQLIANINDDTLLKAHTEGIAIDSTNHKQKLFELA